MIGPRNTGLDVSSFSAGKLATIADYNGAVDFANQANGGVSFLVGAVATGGLVGPSGSIASTVAGGVFGGAIDAGIQYASTGKINAGQTCLAILAGTAFNGAGAVAPTICVIDSLIPAPDALGSNGVNLFAGENITPKFVPNPYGRLGGPAHRAAVADTIADIRAKGLIPGTEFKVLTPDGTKGYRFIDVVGIDPVTLKPVEFFQIGMQTDVGLPDAQ